MDTKDAEDSSSLAEPSLERASTKDLMALYALEESTPIPSTVTSTVETEDLPSPVDETNVEEPVAEPSSGTNDDKKAELSDEEEAILLRPPPPRKSLGPNFAFYSGTYFSSYFPYCATIHR